MPDLYLKSLDGHFQARRRSHARVYQQMETCWRVCNNLGSSCRSPRSSARRRRCARVGSVQRVLTGRGEGNVLRKEPSHTPSLHQESFKTPTRKVWEERRRSPHRHHHHHRRRRHRQLFSGGGVILLSCRHTCESGEQFPIFWCCLATFPEMLIREDWEQLCRPQSQ